MDSLYFTIDHRVIPGYVIDYSGHLVHCSRAGSPSTIIPYSTKHVDSSSEFGSNIFEESTDYINYLISSYTKNSVHCDQLLQSAYPDNRIKVVDELYAKQARILQDQDNIDSIIELYSSLFEEGKFEQCEKIEDGLAECGVFRIPFRNTLLSRYHVNSTISTAQLFVSKYGWYNQKRVISKTILC